MRNDRKGLERSLQSLESEAPVTIVIVDDASDEPVSNLDCVSERHRIVVLRQQRSFGLPSALNLGLRWITNNSFVYTARLDAGDEVIAGRLEQQFSFLEQREEYALVGGQVHFVSTSGDVLFRKRFPTEHAQVLNAMRLNSAFVHPAVMMRNSSLLKVGFYNQKFLTAQDYELFFRLLQEYRGANLSTHVLRYCVSDLGQSTRNRRQQLTNRLRAMIMYFDARNRMAYWGVVRTFLL